MSLINPCKYQSTMACIVDRGNARGGVSSTR